MRVKTRGGRGVIAARIGLPSADDVKNDSIERAYLSGSWIRVSHPGNKVLDGLEEALNPHRVIYDSDGNLIYDSYGDEEAGGKESLRPVRNGIEVIPF